MRQNTDMHYIATFFASILALFSGAHVFGVAQTASSDTLNTLRTNVNSIATIVNSGLSTSTALTTGQVLYSTGAGNVSSAATTTVSCTSGISCTSFYGLGSASSITFSGSATYPVQVSGSTYSLAFGTTTANNFSQIQRFNGSASSTLFSANSMEVGGTATTTVTSAGSIGIGTSTPTYNLTLASGKSAGAIEKDLATSTSMTISPSNGPVQLARIGAAAITLTASGFIVGTKVDLTVCNPNGTAGALTWTGFHTFGTAPTQDTTANKCDKYVVGMTQATSTSAANGIMYYAMAGTGLQ